MKQLFLFTFLLFGSRCAYSQIYKGQWLVGGSGTFSHKSGNDNFNSGYKSTGFSILPDVGYFVINNLTVGARFGYQYAKEKQGYNDSLFSASQTIILSASPFVRYYFLPAKKRVNILADASYNRDWYTVKSNIYTTKAKDQSYTLAAGPVLFLSSYSALELTLSYAHLPHEGYYYNNDISVNIGFQVHLGEPKTKHK